MLYAIMCRDVDNSLEKRKGTRPGHLERLEALKAEGRLVLAGPHPALDSDEPGEAGFTGYHVDGGYAEYTIVPLEIVFPYNPAGVYAEVVVKPFKKVLP